MGPNDHEVGDAGRTEELRDISEASRFTPDPEAPALRVETDAANAVVAGSPTRSRVRDTTVHPYRAIASLIITIRDGSRWAGTGFFVNPRTVVTAGHCLWIRNGSDTQKGPVKSIEVIPARDGDTKPLGDAVSEEFRSPSQWNDHGLSNYDYGVILLKEPFRQPIAPFGLGVYTDAELSAVTANISGYPTKGLLPEEKGTQWFHSRKVKVPMARRIFYETDTSEGQSGAPVWRIVNHRRFAFAIHTLGGAMTNAGTRITAEVHAALTGWMK